MTLSDIACVIFWVDAPYERRALCCSTYLNTPPVSRNPSRLNYAAFLPPSAGGTAFISSRKTRGYCSAQLPCSAASLSVSQPARPPPSDCNSHWRNEIILPPCFKAVSSGLATRGQKPQQGFYEMQKKKKLPITYFPLFVFWGAFFFIISF